MLGAVFFCLLIFVLLSSLVYNPGVLINLPPASSGPAGVDGTRLTPKGYGQDRPLAPNVTAANRTKNRRVQFIILDGK